LTILEMVEVFRTNVQTEDEANRLLDMIYKLIKDHYANFDLNDCDKILRVEKKDGSVEAVQIIGLLIREGYEIEVLSDAIA